MLTYTYMFKVFPNHSAVSTQTQRGIFKIWASVDMLHLDVYENNMRCTFGGRMKSAQRAVVASLFVFMEQEDQRGSMASYQETLTRNSTLRI